MSKTSVKNPGGKHEMIAYSCRILFVAVLLGVLVFVVVTGGKIVWPGNIDWLMVGDDGGTHYLGWEFFRRAPLLQLPPGANPSYGMEISSSIVYTDSIPLLALLIKPIGPLLPTVFQYHGLWLLVCFALQAYFAFRILSLITDDPVLQLVGTAFILTTPVFLFRIWNSHYASAGQWILLAALYFYSSKQFRRRAWIGLLVVAPLVNAYLFVMAGGVYLADLVQRLWRRECSFSWVLGHATLCCLLALMAMWLSGFFMASKYTAGQGFGFYRLNLLAMFNPLNEWSRFVPPLAIAEGEFEGFSYLGLGIILLLVLTLCLLLKSRTLAASKSFLMPVTVVAVGAAIFALSNNIAFGSHEIFSFTLPPRLWPVVSTFRASGRMFWLAYYLICFACLAIVILRCQRQVATRILLLALAIQWVDISGGISELRSKLLNPAPWVSPMQSKAWEAIGRKYDRITVVLPQKHYSDYQPIAEFAVKHNMGTNGVYLARVDESKLRRSQANIEEQVSTGAFDKNSLYIFDDEKLWEMSGTTVQMSDMRGTLDGFLVVAPGLRDCSDCGVEVAGEFRVER